MFMPELDPKAVGQTLSEVRIEMGFSQGELEKATGICSTHISKMERGERKPTLETLYRICRGMDVPMSYMLESLEHKIDKPDINNTGNKEDSC